MGGSRGGSSLRRTRRGRRCDQRATGATRPYQRETPATNSAPCRKTTPLYRLCIRDDRNVLLLPIRSVLYARHDGGQTTIESDQQSLNVRLVLDRLEGVLAPFGFFRSHRAYLVNLLRVRRIVTWSRHVHNLMLDDSKETLVPLAKNRRSALRASLIWP